MNDGKQAALSAIQKINAVDGFDPTPLAVEYVDLNTQEKRSRLPVMAQLAWFRLKYPEGRVSVAVTAAKDCFVATARVYPSYTNPPEQYLSEATASRGYQADKPTVSPREWAQTAAIGIALRNAGFGLQFSAAGDSFDSPAVDELGGIEFDVPVRMSFDDPTQDLHIHYQPGLQHLTGEDVLKVARCRNNSDGPGSYPDNLYGAYPDGDIGRTRTQQQLIAAILKKALSNPQKINSYVNLFLEYVDTDLEFSEALWFAQPALGLDFSTGFASATLAGENVYYVDSRGYRWGSCYELDPEAALETVNSLINPYNAPLTAADLNIFQKP